MKTVISLQSAQQKLKEAGGSYAEAARGLDISKSTLWDMINKPSNRSTKVLRFVITYAQNDTPVHSGFYGAIVRYCRTVKAELIVYGGTYRNPTSPWEAALGASPTWAKEIRPYLLHTDRELNDNLVIYPAKTQPTAVHPLSGFDTHTGHKSGIFPHPKIQLKTIPTPGHMMAKTLTSTGAITVKNYSDSKAGEKGKHHHIYGAAVVEVEDDKIFHLRHINASDDGSFYDLAEGKIRLFSAEHTTVVNEIDSYVDGDWHHPFIDRQAMNATNRFLNKVKCNRRYIHDATDFYRQNHHSRGDRLLNYAKAVNNDVSVEEEIGGLAELLKEQSSKTCELVIVPSNHNDALSRWLNEAKLESLGPNARYFHWLSWMMHASVEQREYGYSFADPLKVALSAKMDLEKHNVRFLRRTDAEIHLNIAYNFHGDKGPNGAKGSPTGFSKIGIKTVIGHGHSPAILDGCYAVGVKSLIPLGYAKDSPGSWMHTDCITYPNGKRTLINIINGKFYL